MTKITYANKETLNNPSSVPSKNKVTANDMNEIKNVINEHDDMLGGGYIVESGTTSTGSYIKFSNGELIQWGRKAVQGEITQAFGTTGINYGYFDGMDPFPIPFVEIPTINLGFSTSGNVISLVAYPQNNNSKIKIIGFYPVSAGAKGNTESFTVEWQAFGKWK